MLVSSGCVDVSKLTGTVIVLRGVVSSQITPIMYISYMFIGANSSNMSVLRYTIFCLYIVYGKLVYEGIVCGVWCDFVIISRAFCETIRMTFGVCVCMCVCVCVCVCVSRAYHLVLLDGF